MVTHADEYEKSTSLSYNKKKLEPKMVSVEKEHFPCVRPP